MNGMDKFLNGRDLVLFRRFGYDRTSRFGDYFNRVDLPEEWVNAVLYAAGTWEIVLSLSFLASGWFCFRKSDEQKRWNSLMLGLSMGAFTFIGFSVFDVISGDRVELLEHGTYLGMIILSEFIIIYLRDRTVENSLPAEESNVLAAHPTKRVRRTSATAAVPRLDGGHNGAVRYGDDDGPDDWMMDQARDIALHNPYITSGHISRQFKIGEGRAHRVMETLEEEGLVIGGRYQRPTVRVR